MTDIDNKLLELQEQEQKEQNDIDLQFDQGGNGYSKEEPRTSMVEGQEEEKGEKKEQNDEDEEEKLAAIKLTKENIDSMIQTMMKESKYDELSIKQTVHGLNSAF